MTRTSEGISSLLAAEKKATEKIEEAKKLKIRRLKTAKEEADKEIETLQRSYEDESKKISVANTGSKDAMVTKINKETEERLRTMEEQLSKHSDQIITRILERVYDIKPRMHENARFEEEPEPEPARAPARRREPSSSEDEEEDML